MRTINITRGFSLMLLMVLLSLNCVVAQPQNNVKQKIYQMKVGFLTEKLDLSTEEAEKFWPVYKEYFDAKEAIRTKFKDSTDPDAVVKQKEEETALLKKYNAKFKSILSNEKVSKLHTAEKEFNQKLIDHIKKSDSSKE